jgi:hypothetical protein
MNVGHATPMRLLKLMLAVLLNDLQNKFQLSISFEEQIFNPRATLPNTHRRASTLLSSQEYDSGWALLKAYKRQDDEYNIYELWAFKKTL